MTAPAVKMEDMLDFYKPEQLSDLVSMLTRSFSQLTTDAFSKATQADVRSFGSDIKTLRANTVAAGVINTAGPNAAVINSTVAKYAEIPPIISAYVPPPAPANKGELAKDNTALAPVISYLSTALSDFCNIILYNIIRDNAGLTDETKKNAIKKLVLSYVDNNSFLSNITRKIPFPGSILDPNFAEISSRLSSILSDKMGVTIVPPGSISYLNIGTICGAAGSHPDTTLRRTHGTIIQEIAVSVRLSLDAIVKANNFTKYNTPANIASLRQIPEMLEKLVKLSIDPMCVQYLTNFSSSVIPIAEPTRGFFANLNSSTFSASLSQKPAGIMNYLITQVLTQLPSWMATFMAWLNGRLHQRGFQTMDQVHRLTAKVVLVVKAYVDILNTIIAVFEVSIQNDPAGLRVANMFNEITLKSGFKLDLVPAAKGGKRYKHKRSRKYRRRRTTRSKRRSRRHM
jgi:hypothetical protein